LQCFTVIAKTLLTNMHTMHSALAT